MFWPSPDRARSFVMVLNGDSTHPIPWGPPTDRDNIIRYYNPEKIYKGYEEKNVPRPNFLTDTSLTWRLGVAAKKGFVFGEIKLFCHMLRI